MARTDFSPTMYADFVGPWLDPAKLLESQRKNLDTLSQANKLAAEGLQAVARRQAEMLQETFAEVAAALKDALSAGSPEASAARQAELAKAGFTRSLANARELAELAAKANAQACECIHRRVMEGLEEFKAMPKV